MRDRSEIFELVLARWKRDGRPPLRETSRILLAIEGVAIGELEALTTRLVTAVLSADPALTAKWTTGTDAERIEAVLDAFYHVLDKLNVVADQLEKEELDREREL
jgi:hypothetical protein